MRLIGSQKRAVRAIVNLQNRGRNKFTLDQFAKEFYKTDKRNLAWRQNVATMLRRIAKMCEEDEKTECRLVRSSRLGRGAIATYTAEGYFRTLIRDE